MRLAVAWGSGSHFCNLNISKLVAITTITRRAHSDQRGGGGCSLCRCPGGNLTCILGGLDNLEKSMGSQSLIPTQYMFPSFGICGLAFDLSYRQTFA